MNKQTRREARLIRELTITVASQAQAARIEFGGVKMRNCYGDWVITAPSQVETNIRFMRKGEVGELIQTLVSLNTYLVNMLSRANVSDGDARSGQSGLGGQMVPTFTEPGAANA